MFNKLQLMFALMYMSKLCKIARVECIERIQIVRLSMLMNNFILWRILLQKIFSHQLTLAQVRFISHVFHQPRKRFLSAKQAIVNAKARHMNAEIVIYFSLVQVLWKVLSNKNNTSIEKDHLGDWSPEKDCCYWLTFRQPVRKPSSESSGSVSQLKIQKPWWVIWLVSR